MSGPPRRAMIVGGPRDGEIVPYTGRTMMEAVPPAPYKSGDPVPETVELRTRVYDLKQWSGAPCNGFRYVLREAAEGLGANE